MQVYTKVDDELIKDVVTPPGSQFNYTAVSEDGIIQLITPKTYVEYGGFAAEYTGTATLNGNCYLFSVILRTSHK